jgi:hypothetical protein
MTSHAAILPRRPTVQVNIACAGAAALLLVLLVLPMHRLGP